MGYFVNERSKKPDPEKIVVIDEHVDWYRKLISSYVKIAFLITKLLRKDKKF